MPVLSEGQVEKVETQDARIRCLPVRYQTDGHSNASNQTNGTFNLSFH